MTPKCECERKVSARVRAKIAIIEDGGRPWPFDEKEFDLLSDIEPLRSEPRGFAPEQMVTCEVCLRANSPTRTSCLYCAAQLPTTQINATLQRPTLRKLEQWERGFSIIFRPGSVVELTQESLGEIGGLLRLKPEELKRIVETGEPLPLARAATREEASLVERHLAEMGVSVLVVGDSDLLSDDSMPKRARAFEFTEK